MLPTLLLQPIHNSSSAIMKTFAEGKPLTPEQLNYLDWHQEALSNAAMDPILQYYLKSMRDHRRKYRSSFLLPHEEMNLQNIDQLKKRIQAFLQKKKANNVVLQLTPEQFTDFKQYAIGEIIFWHANQFLTGAPFIPGGIAPVIFFQWGNLFGIVKYLVLPGEKALRANLLVYFEDRQDRDLERCVYEYNQRLQSEMKLQKELLVKQSQTMIAPEKEIISEAPRLTLANHFLIKPL